MMNKMAITLLLALPRRKPPQTYRLYSGRLPENIARPNIKPAINTGTLNKPWNFLR
jgi:hypothetical protein